MGPGYLDFEAVSIQQLQPSEVSTIQHCPSPRLFVKPSTLILSTSCCPLLPIPDSRCPYCGVPLPDHLRFHLDDLPASRNSSQLSVVLAVESFDWASYNATETMLTRSPVPARSPSASPSSFHTNFHYAPVSPQHRSPKVPTTAPRRPSTTTSPLGTAMTSPSHSSKPQPKPSPKPPPPRERSTKYVGVDAATQYSPMEPHNYFAPRKAPSQPSPLSNTQSAPGACPAEVQAQPAPTQSKPRSNLTIPTSEVTAAAGPQATATTATAPLESEPPMLKAPHPLSPNKRRNSEGPGAEAGESSVAGQAGRALPKRVKPDVAPPKVLPVRYELCAIEDVVVLIANMLAELIETNDALAMRSGHLTRFHSR